MTKTCGFSVDTRVLFKLLVGQPVLQMTLPVS
jgi:hypothetical protein